MVDTRIGPLAVRRTTPRGSGPHEPAVLIHGLGGNSLNWVDLTEALADRLDAVSLDLPGFGSSPAAAGGDYSIRAHTRAAISAIEAVFQGRPVHLFGNSMGGAISTQVAARRPDLVRTLCLVSPALPDRRVRASNVHVPAMSIPGVNIFLYERFKGAGPPERVQATFDLCFADPSRIHPQRRAEAEEEARRRDSQPWVRDAFVGSAQGLLATYFDRGSDRPWALARRVRVPTLLVYGRRDKLVHPRGAHRASADFPNAHLMVIPDSGHVSQMEHPELVQRWWREFLGG